MPVRTQVHAFAPRRQSPPRSRTCRTGTPVTLQPDDQPEAYASNGSPHRLAELPAAAFTRRGFDALACATLPATTAPARTAREFHRRCGCLSSWSLRGPGLLPRLTAFISAFAASLAPVPQRSSKPHLCPCQQFTVQQCLKRSVPTLHTNGRDITCFCNRIQELSRHEKLRIFLVAGIAAAAACFLVTRPACAAFRRRSRPPPAGRLGRSITPSPDLLTGGRNPANRRGLPSRSSQPSHSPALTSVAPFASSRRILEVQAGPDAPAMPFPGLLTKVLPPEIPDASHQLAAQRFFQGRSRGEIQNGSRRCH